MSDAIRKGGAGLASRAAAVAALALLGVGSLFYGFVARDRHLFPYGFFAGVRHMAHMAMSRHAPTPRPGDGKISSDGIDRLANLPYLPGYRLASATAGVRVHDPELAQDGLNFFTSGHAPVATLMDMRGRVVKTWKADARKLFPVEAMVRSRDREREFFRDAELLPDGGIVALFNNVGLVRLDAASRVMWTWAGRVHHDVFLGESGTIWALFHEDRRASQKGPGGMILEDFVVEFSPEGKLLRRLSLLECLERSDFVSLLAGAGPEAADIASFFAGDIFHTNSVSVLDGRFATRLPAFRRGNLLVSMRGLSTIAVVDPDLGRVVWALRGRSLGQHSARLLPSGGLLLFDNFGAQRYASRALELDPLTQQILWSFGGRAGEDLRSDTMGWVQRLSGGNTLITETNSGRVLEVTPAHRMAWEFVNPNRVGRNGELTAVVFSMVRVSRDLPFLREGSDPASGSVDDARTAR
jgi:arylsulfotransferase ASST